MQSHPAPRTAVAPDGRLVAFDVHGRKDGPPVLYLHGVPSSRHEVHVFGLPDAARAAGVQLVAIDRAGIGGSQRKPAATFADASSDVAAVADALGLSRFTLLGYSAGSPFALVTAARLADRVGALGIVSGIAPGDRPDLAAGQAPEVARTFRWARTRPRTLRAVLRGMRLATRRPDLLLRGAARGAAEADLAVLARPGAAGAFAAFLATAFQSGIDGVADDHRLAAGPWPLRLADITAPVRIWHGEQDRNAPIAAARWLHRELPGSQLVTSSHDGHASLLATKGQDILQALTQAAR